MQRVPLARHCQQQSKMIVKPVMCQQGENPEKLEQTRESKMEIMDIQYREDV